MKLPYGIEQVEALQYDDSYKTFLEKVLHEEGMTSSTAAGAIIANYGVKTWLKPVVAHFIETGIIDGSLATEPIQIEKDGVFGDTKLVLPHDVTQPILKQYINDNWASKIQPLVNITPKQRYTPEQFPDLKQRIYYEYLNRGKTGLTIRAIAFKYNVSESTVKRVVRVKKKA